ncbi:MBL fold metallo-hydrolase [Diaphorobacter ruginosibacter]|uniref:MBL fold metallo-hydrolase n=1 Tax=Diaphorobacter ruginosibacter TaxID=1715720 RepID=A0A7G9RJ74_9BURK|nr:MBL fold metallo-hydrolase [Diaphorobacter ruginosibacter]QNN55649.1 MBL fold metallo-hydrolase [Diaphorobacter ruginosibacter]
MQRRTFAAASALAGLLTLWGSAHAAAPLHLQVYNPGSQSMFAVSSELVTGAREAILIDAQFQKNDAQKLVDMVKASGKKLTTIYISHSDPDFYFGLDTLQAAFPQARIVATPQTVAAINASKDGKLAFWGPQLKDNAPRKVVVPEVLNSDHLLLEGKRLEIKGLKGPQPDRSYVWIPSLKAVVGGVVVNANEHVWMADTQTPASRAEWQQTLADITALQPRTVVPGHYLLKDGKAPKGLESVRFTSDYLSQFERAAARARNSQELVAAMKQQYPGLPGDGGLELGAKVVKGEMKWPQ